MANKTSYKLTELCYPYKLQRVVYAGGIGRRNSAVCNFHDAEARQQEQNDFTKGFDKSLMTLSKEMILFVYPLTSTDL